jgi:arylsulfatase A-like enzyme
MQRRALPVPSVCAACCALAIMAGCSQPWQQPVRRDLAADSRYAVWRQGDVELADPIRQPDDDMLTVPAGHSVDFYVRVLDQSVLTIEGIEPPGAPSGSELVVSLQREGETRIELLKARDRARRLVIELPEGSSELARLSFSAGTAADGKAGSFILRQPLLRSADDSTGGESRRKRAQSQQEYPDIFIYLIDTLRADKLGAYGSTRQLTPSIDAFAQQAIVFENAIAQCSWTKPAVVSVLSGITPLSHGVTRPRSALPSQVLTLTELLSAAGYETAGVVSNTFVGKEFGFDQGFDTFIQGGNAVRKSKRILAARDHSKPFFYYVHTLEPHGPYKPPREYHDRYARGVPLEYGRMRFLKQYRFHSPGTELEQKVEALYESEVVWSDSCFGDFIELLKEQGMFRESLVILLSDHGEELWERDRHGHGHSLHSEQLHIPLILKEPGQSRAGRVASLVQQLDILPTVLDYAAIDIPEHYQGVSLRRLVDHDDLQRPIFSSIENRGKQLDHPLRCVTWGRWQLIIHESDLAPELYDLSDPSPAAPNLYAERPITAGYLAALLRKHMQTVAPIPDTADISIDGELRENLKALGYLD